MKTPRPLLGGCTGKVLWFQDWLVTEFYRPDGKYVGCEATPHVSFAGWDSIPESVLKWYPHPIWGGAREDDRDQA